jgi:hypothetical protein
MLSGVLTASITPRPEAATKGTPIRLVLGIVIVLVLVLAGSIERKRTRKRNEND